MRRWRLGLSVALAIAMGTTAPAVGQTAAAPDYRQALDRGKAASVAGRYGEAAGHFEQALAASRRAGDDRGVMFAAVELSLVLWHLNQKARAEAVLEEALPQIRRANNPEWLGAACEVLGELASARQDSVRARAAFAEGIAALRQTPKSRRLAALVHMQADFEHKFGRFPEALALYRQARPLMVSLGNHEALAAIEFRIGVLSSFQGEYGASVAAFQSAAACYRGLGRMADVVRAQSGLGDSYESLGQHEAALRASGDAVATARALGDKAVLAAALDFLVVVTNAAGQHREAIRLQEEANRLHSELKNTGALVSGLRMMATLHHALGEPAQVQAVLLEASKLQAEPRGRQAVGEDALDAVVMQAAVAYQGGHPNEAIRHLRQGLTLARQAGREPLIATMLSGLGTLHRHNGQHQEAVTALQEAVGIYDRIRAGATGDARRDYLGQQIDSYRRLASSLAHLSRVREAIAVGESARARQLAETLGQAESDLAATDLQAVMKSLAPDEAVLLLMPAGETEALSLVITPKGHFAHWKPIQGAVASVTPPAASAAGRRGVELVSDETRPEVVAKSGLQALVAAHRALLADPVRADGPEARAFGRALYDLYVAGHEGRLAPVRRLRVVLDGPLGLMPLEALVDARGRYLAERFDVTYTHSLAVRELLVRRAAARPPATRAILALGGGVYAPASYAHDVQGTIARLRHPLVKAAFAAKAPTGPVKTAVLSGLRTRGLGAFGNLPGTLSEVDAIAMAVPGADVLVGPGATKAALLKRPLATYRMVHFATHGVADFQAPERSGLLLSVGPNDEDTLLSAREVAGLTLNADFVCLSACQTGVGKVVGGEGVVGLSQAFLQAGASGLAMSLWSIDDVGTAAFMAGLYRGDRVPDGAAVAGLKRRMLAGELGPYKSPYFWAPFVYYGR